MKLASLSSGTGGAAGSEPASAALAAAALAPAIQGTSILVGAFLSVGMIDDVVVALLQGAYTPATPAAAVGAGTSMRRSGSVCR